jgi:hypothetical protein
MADQTTSYNTSQYRVITFQVVVAVLVTFIPFLRFYLLGGKRRSAMGLAADLFFGTVWLLTTGMHWTDVWVSVQMTKPPPSAEAAYDLGVRYLKV